MPRRLAPNVPAIVATSVGLVLLVAVTLGWLGFTLLSQEETLVRQRLHDRVEQAADTLLATFLRTVADTESWLAQVGPVLPGEDHLQVRPGGILVMFSPRGVETHPRGALPYLPVPPPLPDFDASLFEQSEIFEFQSQDLAGAATSLAPLTASANEAVRAEAWLRLARVRVKQGNHRGADDAYARLVDVPLMSGADAPYGLISRFARLQLAATSTRHGDVRGLSESLLTALESGQFIVGKDGYAWYDARTRELGGIGQRTAPHQELAVAAVVEQIWDQWQVFQRSGSRSLTRRLHASAPVPVVAVVNANPERLIAQIHAGEAIRAFGLDPAANGDRLTLRVTVTDAQGRTILGDAGPPSGLRATRVLSAAELPWHLTLAQSGDDAAEGMLAARRIYFGLALGGVVLLVCAACYAMARGVLREAAAGQLQSDFVSAVSHEFRSPLTTLRQLTELLAQGRIQDETRRRRYFDVLQQETLRLQHLVENLLDFGRMDAGRRQYRLEPVDFTQLVRDGVEQYQTEAGGSGHRIELKADPATLVVEADREAIGRVVRNLLENAVKYSPDAQTVWVEMAGDDRAAVLRVRDEGIGIPPEEQGRIFDKFVRGESAKRACIPGTGVGLAMVREIVQMHRGQIELSSAVGSGSTFEVRLPLREMHEAVS